jgi:hypothetical protein
VQEQVDALAWSSRRKSGRSINDRPMRCGHHVGTLPTTNLYVRFASDSTKNPKGNSERRGTLHRFDLVRLAENLTHFKSKLLPHVRLIQRLNSFVELVCV